MMNLIVNFTPTGMVSTKAMTPHVPITAGEIADQVQQAVEIGITVVHLHARDEQTGEPFLNPDLLNYFAHLKKAGSHCSCHTNGTLLNPSILDRLVDLELDNLVITTMAGTAEMYALTHPGCPAKAFETIEDNLRYLAERKRARRTRAPRVRLSFIVIRQNVEGIAAFAEFAACMGVEIGCYYLWYGVKIGLSGNVYPCCRCNAPIGNIFENPFTEIWQGEAYRRFRGEARHLPKRLDSLPGYHCHSCIHYPQNIGLNRLFHPFKSWKALTALVREEGR